MADTASQPRSTSRTALVTGASSGMGKAFAKRLLAEGMTVFVAARRIDKMADLAEAGAIPLRMDISSDEDIVAAVAQINEHTGGVDVLVNNAGFGLYGAVEDTTIADARYQFEVNLFGLARLTQLLLPAMRARKAGTIVNITSMGGKIYTPLGAWYHATKHALEGWSDALRLELKPHGIDVVIIEPGIIMTEFGNAISDQIMERSGGGAYGDLAGAIKQATDQTYAANNGSSPDVIADLVANAVKAPRPRTRYAGGRMARPLLFLRWLVSDRTFDRLIMSQINSMK